MEPKKVVGNTYGRLTITKLISPHETRNKRTHCICDCSCGRKGLERNLYELLNGYILSCGCLRKEVLERATVKLSFLDRVNERKRFASLTSPGEYKKYVSY